MWNLFENTLCGSHADVSALGLDGYKLEVHHQWSNFKLRNHRAMAELDPDVADDVPWSESVTAYDERHLITYLRLLDAQNEGADWREVARIILHRDAAAEPDRARLCWEAHLRRANWIVEHGYRRLLTGARAGKMKRATEH